MSSVEKRETKSAFKVDQKNLGTSHRWNMKKLAGKGRSLWKLEDIEGLGKVGALPERAGSLTMLSRSERRELEVLICPLPPIDYERRYKGK